MDKRSQASKDSLIGTRIRERREISGLKQADLAQKSGISASYLNLIEHNRRRIGGKLLMKIAEVLGVDVTLLRDGAEATLLSALREAEADADRKDVELSRIEEFAGRFPGWARLVVSQNTRIAQLEQTVEGLNDRIAHDPELAAWVHEVLSTAASIRSTASILVETDALEPEWLDRFHTNINEDSARLADSSRALAGYLESGQDRDGSDSLPQEEVDQYLAAHDYAFEGLETGRDTPAEVLEHAKVSRAAKDILGLLLTAYCEDARKLPLEALRAEIERHQVSDPVALARALSVPVGVVMRRMASLPELEAGYVMCDRSGSLLLRKPLPGFDLPRFGASCPLWPIFQAIAQPETVVHQEVVQLGRREVKFDCFAVAETAGPPVYNMPPLVRSGMLILPTDSPGDALIKVGSTCRLCPRARCPGRREPSVLPETA